MSEITATDIAKMPVSERIRLVEEIWDSVAEIPEAIEVPEWHKEELDRRIRAFYEDPAQGSSWADVKRRILR